MQGKQTISYRQFTSRFMTSLKQQRQQVITVLNQTSNTQQFISKMLDKKTYAKDYANQMQSNNSFDRIFKTMRRKIGKDISQSEFQSVIDYLAQDLDNKFEYADSAANSMDLLVTALRSAIRQEDNQGFRSNLKGEIKERNQKEQQDLSTTYNHKQEFAEDDWTQQRPYNRQNQDQLTVTVIPKSKIESKSIQKPFIKKSRIDHNHSHPQKMLKIQKNQPIFNIPQHQEPIKRALEATQLVVEVRYLSTSVDYDKYEYNDFSLKLVLQQYVRKYLTQNQVIVRRQVPEIKIMEEIDFIKSKQAGNYRFNPFCDALEIWLKIKNKSDFNYDFSVSGNLNKLQFISKPILPNEWNKTFMKLTPKSTIDELVKYVCQKRQATQQLAKILSEGLKNLGGANIAQDLFGWERSDFANMKVKPTYIFQIQQLIEQIKDSSSIVAQRSVDEERKQCIKIATSHKVLRYLVYKLEGQVGVKKIAWLNMKNLKNAVNIVRRQIHNKELLDQLEDYFNQFALDPDGKPLAFSRGMILYGPPGTGKTVLTESLPNIIGFHLIQKGLSAADFMKSLVGQTSRMIKDLVNRAAISPYLLCSIGIDQVDGLVPDRKDKDEKNKGEGISIMLSVIGGNKDVPNLTFMTSTNYIKKIDEAIGRRLSGKFQVGRPNPIERGSIILQKIDYLKDKEQLLEHLIRITTNFTGAALGGLANSLLKSLKIKKMNNQPQKITIDQITDATILIAKQFNITLGVYTLPQIYRNQCDKKFIFTQTFLKRISKHFLLVQHLRDNEFRIMYANEIQKFFEGKVMPVYEKEEDKVNVEVKNGDDFDSFIKYVTVIFEGKKYDIQCFKSSKYEDYNTYSKKINDFLNLRQKSINKKTVLIIQDHPDYPGEIRFTAKLFERNHHNLYLIYYVLPGFDLNVFSQALFGSNKNTAKNKNSVQNENYSGRIMVELNDEARMAFQLNNCMEMESKVAFRLFLKSEGSNSPKTVIPQLVDFFTKQQVSYLLLIDYELLLQNDAFEQKKILQVMQQKMLEAKTYKKSAVIIDLDSMILLNQNASDSNFGRSMSYSIQNYNLYQILLNYMREFASTAGNDSRWMTMIVKHPQLVNIIKKQLSWPKYPQELQKQRQQQALDEEKHCCRCNAFYTERQNKQERKCMQHPGRIINTLTKTFENKSAQQLKAHTLCIKKKDQKVQQNRYVYACCLKGLNEQGENAYYHITEDQFEKEDDELFNEGIGSADKWQKVLKYFDV